MIVHVVGPVGFDDPARPSGGNRYDLKVIRALRQHGWTVVEHQRPAAHVLATLNDDDCVLVDGLISAELASTELADRRVFLLVHLPLGLVSASARETERSVLSNARGVIVTSGWTRQWLLTEYQLEPERVFVAEPGVHPAPLTTPGRAGNRLLCVAAVARHKGQHVLVDALQLLADLDWRCRLVGPLDREPDYVAALRRDDSRIELVGALDEASVATEYARADLVVLPSLGETYGMVVTEALARGLPVVASDVGGVPEAIGFDDDGRRPGLLVQPGDPADLAAAVERWLTEPAVRARLRHSATQRRAHLSGWDKTATQIGQLLGGEPAGAGLRIPR